VIGVYDFCGHYEWTFAWLEQRGGPELLRDYWDEAIHQNSQRHAAELIRKNGFEGMKEYWGHTLAQEGAGYRTTISEKVFRIDMYSCPSKGFLIRNGLQQHADYCDHCIGWIGPMLLRAGFTIDHQHNHCGQCWWEMRRIETGDSEISDEKTVGKNDVRHASDWNSAETVIDTFLRANGSNEKKSPTRPPNG
jgi:hypothetical protein